MLDINCADDPTENEGPLAALSTASAPVLLTTSLALGDEGLRTCGLPPAKARELCEAPGFSKCEQVDMEKPFNNLYDVRPYPGNGAAC